MGWKLKRLNQCAKCPWKVDTDPFDIPDGYSEELHCALADTIAEPGSMRGSGRIFACHESPAGDPAHCVGWLHHQLGVGNNIGLRLQMLSCENIGHLHIDGEQHATFEDTLPEGGVNGDQVR